MAVMLDITAVFYGTVSLYKKLNPVNSHLIALFVIITAVVLCKRFAWYLLLYLNRIPN